MSELIAPSPVRPLDFREIGIDAAFEACRADFEDFRVAAAGRLLAHSEALLDLHGRILRKGLEARNEEQSLRTTTGFLVAHEVLIDAVGGSIEGRMPIGQREVKGYVMRIDRAGVLEADFARDYAGHPLARELVDARLTNPDSKFGARLLLALHGLQANSSRPPIALPYVPTGNGELRAAAVARRQRGVPGLAKARINH